ncbi:MAG: two-component system response regulator [Myxococcota bacterium]|jgi:two-component system response regulator
MSNTNLCAILLVEDSPEDREALVRALRKSGVNNPIYTCEDGDEALDYLYQRGAFADKATSPRPGLVLLDLNLPGTDGREVLEEIKSQPELKRIPIVVMTTSNDPDDVDDCYAAGANSYVQKPVDLELFVQTIERIKEFWLSVAILPADLDLAGQSAFIRV